MTETDSDITRGYDSITRSYNEWDWEDDSITNSYSGYNEKLWSYNEKL